MAGLPVRVASAAVLAPPVLAALYFGSPYVEILVVLAGGLMAWEGTHLVPAGKRLTELVAVAAAAIALGAAAIGRYELGGWILALGAAGLLVAQRGQGRSALVLAGGLVYVGAACLAFLWLRRIPEVGLGVVAWLVASVWATDIGAYLVGRSVGGPRLAPVTSPKKTWAGLLGGMASAAAVGAATALLLQTWLPQGQGHTVAALALAGAALALVAQAGDLLESAFKRHFRVKDASSLIPGHGGLLDRVDGLLSASLALALVLRLAQGA